MRSAPLVFAIALGLGLSATTQTTAAIQAQAARATDKANNGIYIVTFTEAPLARYAGGALNAKTNRVMAATTPTIAGGRKLNVHSVESRAYLEFLSDRRQQHLADASARIGRPLAAKFVYDAVLNGVAVQMSPAEAARLRGMPGIAKVEADFKRHVTTDRGPQWIKADKIWNGTATAPEPGNHGETIVVGVIDTGVNRTHPSFSGAGLTNPRGKFYGLCASNASLCNNKLIGMYDFTTGSGDAEPNDGLDKVGHGSHTASTAVGAPMNYTITLSTGAQVVNTRGVAYGANLITYKACEDKASCQGSWLIAALNQAVLDQVDVLSFSIGGGLDDPWTDSDTKAMLDARTGGTVVAVAAGNDGPNAGSLTSPSNAPWVLSVAATSHDRIYANKLDLSGGSTAPPNGGVLVGAADTVGTGVLPMVRANPVLCDEGSNTTGTAGENKPAAWNSTTYPGKMVVCDRGIYPRVSKSKNVQLAGGAAMVLLNQITDGNSIVADPHVIPSTHLGYSDSQALLTWLSTGSGHKGKLEGTVITNLASQGDNLASFSGRGPVDTPAGVLKPDITAPGVSIIAASNVGAGFNTLSGTSMATPHAAGAAALLMKAHPIWGPSQVISAMIGTARPSNKVGNNQIGTPFDQGAGTLDLAKAVRVGLS
ncbi:MAG: S8 family serine peptidase, partial [Lysobacteraceae bacterium]